GRHSGRRPGGRPWRDYLPHRRGRGAAASISALLHKAQHGGYSGRDPARTISSTGMSVLRVTGGRIYDPANGLDGVVRDLWVVDGRIVADPGAEPPAHDTIDISG